MVSEDLPHGFEECIDLYLTIWSLFSEQIFTPRLLTHQLIDYEHNIEHITDENEPQKYLNLLVAAGLVNKVGDNQYRIRCPPNTDLEYWKEQQTTHVERIYQSVQQHQGSRDTPRENRLQRQGATFQSVSITRETTLSQLTAAVDEILDSSSNIAGVVIRSPADLAHHVQQLADSLCDPEQMTTIDWGPLEKVTADVVGEHKDDLEYRLYLLKGD